MSDTPAKPSDATIHFFRQRGAVLPTFRELAAPSDISPATRERVRAIDPDEAHPLNLFRVHWHNAANRRDLVPVPEHIELPPALTGVKARIVVVVADRFPLVRTHKVLAAYACLVPLIVTGQFEPSRHRAIWPSTGNYCRGGVAISRILGCRAVAMLPEGMSAERFEWLRRWVASPDDIVRTPGSESNVKEIFDACTELERDPDNVVLNQFSEFGNHLAHYHCSGPAFEAVFRSLGDDPNLALRAFVSASGSAGTLGAGDYLKERHGARIVAAEALECPTLLENGFGEHNIQGIGDKHVPFIHNVMNTDVVVAVSDRATDALNVLFNSREGAQYLVDRRGVDANVVDRLASLGLSSICNVVASIKIARHLNLGEDDVVLTVATDGAPMYVSEREKTRAQRFAGGFDERHAGEVAAQYLLCAATDHVLELDARERARIFNLGYYTWVEQRGVSVEAFDARRAQTFWRGLRAQVAVWDEMIVEFNQRTGVVHPPYASPSDSTPPRCSSD
jgi:cysteine synthase